jgi:hypothetical protein
MLLSGTILILDDQPGDELKVPCGFHLFAHVGELAATPGERIARILSLELRSIVVFLLMT